MYYIIVNPVAGKGLSTQYLPQLVTAFKKRGLSCKAYVTKKPRDGYYAAKRLCQDYPNCEGIIGMGGDGTIQEIAAGMTDAFLKGTNPCEKIPIPLGIFPGGSGNDSVMALKGGKATATKYRKNINNVANTIAEAALTRKFTNIDLITANGEAFLVAANMGIDARIVHDAIALKPKFGGQAYLIAAYKSIMNHENIPMEIHVNGQTISKDFTLIAVSNANTYGGGLQISPSAKFDDGKITLCMVNGLSRLKLGVLFPSLLIKQHVHLKDINYIDCTEFRLTLPRGTETLCKDGNLSPVNGEIHFKILPGVLDVFA